MTCRSKLCPHNKQINKNGFLLFIISLKIKEEPEHPHKLTERKFMGKQELIFQTEIFRLDSF